MLGLRDFFSCNLACQSRHNTNFKLSEVFLVCVLQIGVIEHQRGKNIYKKNRCLPLTVIRKSNGPRMDP